MLRIACESCKAPYQVDERRVPAQGLKMRCPKCGTTFLVTHSGTSALAGGPAKQPQMTMVEGNEAAIRQTIAKAEEQSALTKAALETDLPATRSPAKPPAPGARPAPPKPAAPAPVAAKPVPPAPAKPAPPAPVAKAAPPKPGAPRPGLPEPDSDLPAARPSPPRAAPKPPPIPIAKPAAPAPPAAPVVKAPMPKMSDFELPAVRTTAPKPGAAKPTAPAASAIEGSEWDLPAVPGGSDLPALVKPGMESVPPALGRLDDLPAARAAQKASPPAAPTAAFGEIEFGLDLPAPMGSGDLPAVQQAALPATSTVGLPARVAPGLPAPVATGLPARKMSGDFELDLGIGSSPEPSGFELDMPPPPKAAPAKAKVDDGAFGELDLPMLGSALPAVADVLPAPADALPVVQASLPAPQQSLPAPQQALPAVQPSFPANALERDSDPDSLPPAFQTTAGKRPSAEFSLSGFGELDLGGADVAPPPPKPATAGPVDSGFGEIDLGSVPPPAGHEADVGDSVDDLIGGVVSAPPPRPDPPPAPPTSPASKGEGNALAFGELDLGGGGGEASIPTEAQAPRAAASEASLPMGPAGGRTSAAPAPVEVALPTALPGSRTKRTEDKRPSRAPRIILIVLALAIAGGGALQLTKHGAFGYLTITDKLRADEYVKSTTAAASSARTRMGKDTVVEGRGAVDDVFAARGRTPRARPLSAYAAFTTFAYETRFGADPQRDSRAKSYLTDVKDEPDVKYYAAALAAQDAAAGNWDKAAKGLDAVAKRDAGDPIQRDIAELRGGVALAQKDWATAKTSFETALKLAPTARSHFGLAQALLGLKDSSGATKELEATLAATPNHPAALVLRAMMTFAARDEKGALADLTVVIDGPGKPLASTQEYADALAVRGFIQAKRGRGGEARTSFESAIASDPNNVHALLGLGEVYFDEGRYTEALTRLDTALAKSPSDPKIIALDAMVKAKLERLKEAKDQIVAARVEQPKSMLLALTQGMIETSLGNRSDAEKALAASVDLVTEADGNDGVAAYVAYASFLAADGRPKEADAKLDDMKLKLPDSVEMQRMLGVYDASQGRFDSAVTHFRNAIDLDPQDTSTRFQLAVTLRRMRHMEEAATEFDKVLAADKDYPGLALERGLLYEESGEVEKALEQFKNALAKAPDDLDLTVRVGAAYVAIGRPDDALPMLKKVLEKRPQSAEANHYLGRALLAKGGASLQEATRYLKHAVELDPNRAEYHLYLAWAANENNPVQLGLAEDEVNKALAIDKLLADAYWQRGVTERKKGLVDDALKDLRRALELKPNRIEAHATIAECFEDKNDEGTALAEWQKAIAGNDRQPYWRYRYGKLLLQHGNAAEAAKHLGFAATEGEKLEGRTPWLGSAQFYAAEAYRRSGRRDDAIGLYEKFLSTAPMSSPDRRDAIVALSQLGKPYGGGDRR